MNPVLLAFGLSLLITGLASAAGLAAEGDNGSDKEFKHVDAAGAAKLLKQNKDVIVLDVRTADEFKDGHLAKAKNIDFRSQEFGEKVGKLDREKTYLVHCASGRRSTSSLATFKKFGFKSVIHLDGGYNGWQKDGNPVEK